jgi:hypothetical protein
MHASFSPSGLRRVDAVVASFIERGVIAGAVTLVARKAEVVHLSAQGHMDLANGTPPGWGAVRTRPRSPMCPGE